MPKFSYIVRDKSGNKKSGTEEAASQEELISSLQAKDLVVVNIFPEQEEILQSLKSPLTAKIKPKAKHSRITSADLTLFCRQISTLLGAGVTILRSLNIIAQQVNSRSLYKVIKSLEKDMEGVVLFMNIKIIPAFIEIFSGFNIKLPLLTQIILLISNFIRKYILVMFGAMVVGFWFLRQFLSTRAGKKAFEVILYKIPLLGEFFRILAIERFTSEMSTLVESGVPILYALEISERSVGSVVLGKIVSEIKNDVREGRNLSQSLAKSGFFDPMVVQMVAIGEEIGDLSNMFKRLSGFYQDYINTFLSRIMSMFEPIMLVVMGVVIGTMVLGMFLPIFQLTQIK
ncbi:MAG: type II secretion system F family protein [Candidatus Omnitrophica bacterium]|nr:type II secretion system F family protein [Candidatus Omnitrophota bacterium]